MDDMKQKQCGFTQTKLLIAIGSVAVLAVLFVSYIVWAHQLADQARPLAGMGAAAVYSKNPVAAEQAIQRNPANANAHAGLAAAYMIKGNKTAAIAEYRKVLELEPGNEDAMLWLAHLLISTGQPQEGRQMYQKLSGKDDDYGKDARMMLKDLNGRR